MNNSAYAHARMGAPPVCHQISYFWLPLTLKCCQGIVLHTRNAEYKPKVSFMFSLFCISRTPLIHFADVIMCMCDPGSREHAVLHYYY